MNVTILVRRWKGYKPWFDISAKIDLWNSVCRIPFTEFRKELSNIAFDNHNMIGADKIYYYINDFDFEYYSKQNNHWIIPIDDDDWLCNDVCTILKNMNIEQNVICWKCNIITTKIADGTVIAKHSVQESSIDLNQDIQYRTSEGFCHSCCYAVKNDKINEPFLFDHGQVANTKDRIYINNIQSMYLALPQSTWRLIHDINSSEDLINHIKEVKNLPEKNIPPQFIDKLKKLKSLFEALL